MMYTAATAAAVDYQFRKYMANKQSLESRIRKRITEMQAVRSQNDEGLTVTKNTRSDSESPESCDLENPGQKPNVRDNPPRAGPLNIFCRKTRKGGAVYGKSQ